MPLKYNWPILALSAAGVAFIFLGLIVLALPTAQEGVHIWQLDSEHAFYFMDAAGVFALGLGVILTWLGGRLWKQMMQL
jgi:hypothetical protein